MALHIGRQNELIGRIFRREGGAITLDLRADLDTDEIAAIMTAISDQCVARGIHPGRLASALSDIQIKRNHPGARRVS
jgi:hypothetical protein